MVYERDQIISLTQLTTPEVKSYSLTVWTPDSQKSGPSDSNQLAAPAVLFAFV